MKNRSKRNHYCSMPKGYYHFSTSGLQNGKLFYTAAQFAYGMTLIGLITLWYDVKVYAFVLMPNHVHIILSGTGEDCVKAFDFLRRKISARLIEDDNPPLPEDYDFVLIPINDKNHMRSEIEYVLRNPLEKNYSTPEGYPWGSGWICHSEFPSLITGTKASDIPVRELRNMCNSKISIPDYWQFHPVLGLLPESFVDKSLIIKLFPSAKDFESLLVKDYESYSRIAKELGESPEYSDTEIADIRNQVLQTSFKGNNLNDLTTDSKYSLIGILSTKFNMSPKDISRAVYMREAIVRQVLNSKEFKSVMA